MFETLFGSEVPLAARFFIAFLVVLALIGLTAWLVRRFGANRLGNATRGRQPRLAVIDAATVDGRRRLVLIRRDNIEHLLMIGGPTDVVVEANIVRATGAREPARPSAVAEPAPRATPSVEGAWPLQPSSEPPALPAPRPSRASATEEPWLAPEPPARTRPADTLSGLAAELSTRLNTPEAPARSEAPVRPTLSVAPVTPPPVVAPPVAAPPVMAPPVEPPAPPPQTDHNLAEMAQQLEAALRRTPAPESRPPVTDALAAPPVKPAAPRETKPRIEPKFEPTREAKIEPPAEPKLAPPVKPPLDNLDEEMANLLGRQSGKT
jgi:flagellar protein FliO/FliZ